MESRRWGADLKMHAGRFVKLDHGPFPLGRGGDGKKPEPSQRQHVSPSSPLPPLPLPRQRPHGTNPVS